METQTLLVDPQAPDEAVLEHAAALLRAGQLVAFATETVYGLGADATSEAAVRKIFEAKGRPSDNPLIVHAADTAMAQRYAGQWPQAAQWLAEHGWPGPLTLVVPKAATIPSVVTAGLDTVGLRVPQTAVARGLIARAGVPLAAPSANRSEHISPTLAPHVLDDLDGAIACVLDSGATSVGIESTVVDCCGPVPKILRPGPIDAATLEQWLGAPLAGDDDDAGASDDASAADSGVARSPGQRPRHYAPQTPAIRVGSFEALGTLAIGPEDIVLAIGNLTPAVSAKQSITLLDPTLAAQQLYAMLRYCDGLDAARIVVIMPPDEPAWHAVSDRLRRATVPAEAG